MDLADVDFREGMRRGGVDSGDEVAERGVGMEFAGDRAEERAVDVEEDGARAHVSRKWKEPGLRKRVRTLCFGT